MKENIILLCFLLTVINSKSQWSRVHISEPFEDRIYEIHFPNSDTGYAVGECDCIHKTTDGGETWFDIPLVGIEGLLDVYFVDGNVGYASNPRRFLKTTDGGYTWEDKWPDFMPIANFTEIYFSNEDTGWIAGDFVFSVIRTFDGMDSYVFQDIEWLYGSWQLQFTSPDIGFIFGGQAGGNTSVFTSIDGGTTWHDYDTLWVPTDDFYDVYFVNDTVGYGHQLSDLYKTTDGTKTWVEVNHDFPITFGGISAHWYYKKALHFVNPDTGFAIKGDRIFRTENGGVNWVETSVENPTIFSEIHCLNADTCFAVGKGRIYRTTNGGGTLSNIQQHTPQVAEISIYPNPTSEMLYVSFHPKTTAITTLHITNSLGAVVAAYELPPGTSRQQLDVGHLPVGVYHVSVAGLAGQRLVVVGQ